MSATGILPKVFVTAKTLSGFDLSPFIYEFKYEECMDKDNLFSISLIDTIKYKLIDNDELKIHDKLEISWGYAGDHRNERTRTIAYRYIGDIINREVTYKDSITLELELLCPTNKMKNNYFSKNINIHELSDKNAIIEILKEYGFYNDKVKIDSTVDDNKSGLYIKAHNNDLELIYDLANRVNSGHNIYIIGDVFHITKANLNDKPYRDYTLGDNIISFKAKFDKKTAKSNRASAKEGDEIEAGYDASTGEPIRATVPKSNSTTLGENMMKIRYDGSVTRIKGEQTKTDVDKKLQNGVDNNEENSDKELVADLEILGDPALNINTIITLKGVAESHMGNWLITQVTHEISGKSSYITTCKLLKNGTIKPMTTEDTKSSNVNKKIPTKEAYYKIYYAPNKADEKIIPK